jgi:hypothetical protein
MKTKYVLPRGVLPTNLPIMNTCLAYLLLDNFNAPQWVWGAVGVFLFFLWCASITLKVIEVPIDLKIEASKEKVDVPEGKSRFIKRLEDAMAKQEQLKNSKNDE